MNKIITYSTLLVLLSGCDQESNSDGIIRKHLYHGGYPTIVERQCFICQDVPTAAHTRQINEKESITVHYCEKHLAAYILETE